MNDLLKRLKELKNKILSTWDLLQIDEMEADMREAEKDMRDPNFWKDRDRAARISKKYEELKNEIKIWSDMNSEVDELISLCEDLKGNPDAELENEIKAKISDLEKKFEGMEFYLLLGEKHDKKNAIIAVHAGSGGTEAQDWAEMLLRMLVRYCEKHSWKVRILDQSRGHEAGVKSAVFHVEGMYAYGHLKSEHGTHRLVRISPFDAEKMRHTSFALVEVIPEIETGDSVEIDPKDLRIDTFMSGGHGGQSVNTTYSAVRVVHIPTNITVRCQNERSQLQNKEMALKILRSKLRKLKEEKEEKEKRELRGEYKSAEWGNQIRSYVLHPYKMVKDLRSKYEEPDPDKVLDGDLDGFVEAYLKWRKSAP